MAFTQSSLVDIIFKKFVTSQGTVDNSKQYFEEPYSSRNTILPTDLWLQSDQIPNIAANVPGIVQQVTLTMSYVAGTKGAFYNSNLVDIIPFNFGTASSYTYQVFRNDGTTPIALGQCDWLIDTNAGTIVFYTGAVSGTITDPLTSTVIATSVLPPKVTVYKYIGKKGIIPNLNGLTYSGGTMSINVGSGLTFSNGLLVSTTGNLGSGPGLTLSGSTYSLSINTNGLTFSGNNLAINIGNGLTFSNGQLQTVITAVAGNGLTSSGNTFSVNLSSNSGLTVSSSGLSINSNISGTGITFSNGQIALSNPIYFSNGITSSGNTYSVNINSNGLTFSNSQVSLNIGSGLTFSSGRLTGVNLTTAGNGLTNNGNTFSILLDSNPGLTVSATGLRILTSLLVATSSVTLGSNVIGQYTTDPTSNASWGALSIPSRAYVDSIASGLNLKQSVRVAATGSISINSAPSTIDGVSLSSGDRVLLWRQDDTINGTNSNGIYVFNGAGVTMSRALDFDGSPANEVTTGSYTFVTEGTTYQGGGFVIVAIGTASGNIVVGTQSMKWTQFNSVVNYVWNDGLIASGNSINVDLASNGGLTFSSSQLSVALASNSGLQLSNGLSLNSSVAGTGITFSSGQLSLSNPIYFTSGITNSGSGNNWSLDINPNGLTLSASKLALNIGTGLTFSNGQLQTTITAVAGSGLTSSGNTFSVNLNSNGLTFSNNQVSLNIGTGLTFNSGQLTLTNPINFESGITSNGNTYSVNLNSNGLTFSNSQVSLNIGTGLTFSNSQLQTTITAVAGTGLTSSGNTFSVNINSNGLTFSNNQVSLNIGTGLTFSNSQLQTSFTIGSGLTQSGPTISLVTGNGLEVNGVNQLVTKVDTTTGLYNNTGTNYIYWSGILGSGLTWSGSQLNTTSALLQKYSTTVTFTASVAQTVTHNLNTTDFVIQIYDNSTGDEVMAQYTNRAINTIVVTTFDNITGRVVIIG